MEITEETLDMLLLALAEQLRSLGEHLQIVVIGGSALTALGLVRRATRDVDLLAIAENGELRPAEPLPDGLRTARERVARDFELDENWLNAGPAALLEWGPAGRFHVPGSNAALRPGPYCSLRGARRPDPLQTLCNG